MKYHGERTVQTARPWTEQSNIVSGRVLAIERPHNIQNQATTKMRPPSNPADCHWSTVSASLVNSQRVPERERERDNSFQPISEVQSNIMSCVRNELCTRPTLFISTTICIKGRMQAFYIAKNLFTTTDNQYSKLVQPSFGLYPPIGSCQ